MPITTLLDTTHERTAEQLAEMNARQVEEVRLVLEEVTLSRRQTEEKQRAEHERQDRELRDVCNPPTVSYSVPSSYSAS